MIPGWGPAILNDVSAARPIFRNGTLVGFAGVVAHMADIGGIMWSATSREIFEEGLQIPRMKLFAGGEPNATAFQFIKQNVRKPDIVEGDLYAMLAAAEVVDRRLNEFLDGFGAGALAAAGRRDDPPRCATPCAGRSQASRTASTRTRFFSMATDEAAADQGRR